MAGMGALVLESMRVSGDRCAHVLGEHCGTIRKTTEHYVKSVSLKKLTGVRLSI